MTLAQYNPSSSFLMEINGLLLTSLHCFCTMINGINYSPVCGYITDVSILYTRCHKSLLLCQNHLLLVEVAMNNTLIRVQILRINYNNEYQKLQIKFVGYIKNTYQIMHSFFTPKLRSEFGNSHLYKGIFSPSCFSFATSLGLQGSRRIDGENVVNFKHIIAFVTSAGEPAQDLHVAPAG